MISRYLCVALLAASLMVCGCKSNQTVKDIAAARKAGKADAARELALAALEKSPDNLLLWRELAATDVVLADAHVAPEDPAPYRKLTEAALICTAVYEHNHGKLTDDAWKATVSRTAQMTVSLANRALNNVEVTNARGKSHLGHRPLTEVELQSERYVSVDDMESAIRQAVPLILFARHLGPVLSNDISSSIDELEMRVQQMGQNTNITTDTVNRRCAWVTEQVVKTLDNAAEELTDTGSFQFDTILHNPLFE